MMPYIVKIPPQLLGFLVVQVLDAIGRVDVHVSLQGDRNLIRRYMIIDMLFVYLKD